MVSAGAAAISAATVLAVLAAALLYLPASSPAAAQSSGFSSPTLAPDDDLTFRGAGWGHGVGISHQSLPARTAAGQTAGDILNFYYPGTVLTGGWQLDDLRVFLAAARNSRFRPRGPFEIVVDGSAVYSSSTSQLFSVSRDGNDWTVTASDGALLCQGRICSGNVLQIRTADGTAVESSATRHSYNHGQMTLTQVSGDSWYRIVLTHLEIEDYLGGVAEVPPDWSTEALRAQAIASRTYALHIARENRGSDTWTAPFDIYATTMSQVYDGNTRELSARNGPWLQAVADTAGQVLTYNGTPALALFTTSGGGYTENSGYAFNEQHPYLVAAEDHFTAGDPYTSWTRTYSVGALSRWLARGDRHQRRHAAAHRRVGQHQRLRTDRPGNGATHRHRRHEVGFRPAFRVRDQQGRRIRGLGAASQRQRPRRPPAVDQVHLRRGRFAARGADHDHHGAPAAFGQCAQRPAVALGDAPDPTNSP